METFILNILNGLSHGMLLFLISVGLTTVFGVLGILNFAHGSFFMLGAYFGMQAVKIFNSFWLGLIFGPIIVMAVGFLTEFFLLRKIYARNVTFQLLLTFALLLVIDDSVRMVWGSGYYIVNPPVIFSGTMFLLGQQYPVYRIFLIMAGVIAGLGLWSFFHFTKFGKIVRAASFDREMAEGVGINVPMVFTCVFLLGTWLAALGGVLAAPQQSLNPSMGERIIIESFIVVVVGGMGSFPGALIGAIMLGLLESFGTVFAGNFQMALPYLLLAVILIFKPNGLFKKGV